MLPCVRAQKHFMRRTKAETADTNRASTTAVAELRSTKHTLCWLCAKLVGLTLLAPAVAL